jgi:hypothetical protein
MRQATVLHQTTHRCLSHHTVAEAACYALYVWHDPIVSLADSVVHAMSCHDSKALQCQHQRMRLLQVISQEEQWARTAFYEKHGIAFVARPPLGRRGVFKKASNLNYQLAVSDKVSTLVAERRLSSDQALLKVRGVTGVLGLQAAAGPCRAAAARLQAPRPPARLRASAVRPATPAVCVVAGVGGMRP